MEGRFFSRKHAEGAVPGDYDGDEFMALWAIFHYNMVFIAVRQNIILHCERNNMCWELSQPLDAVIFECFFFWFNQIIPFSPLFAIRHAGRSSTDFQNLRHDNV